MIAQEGVHLSHCLLKGYLELPGRGEPGVRGELLRQRFGQGLTNRSAVNQSSHTVGHSGKDSGGLLTGDAEGVLLAVPLSLLVEHSIAADRRIRTLGGLSSGFSGRHQFPNHHPRKERGQYSAEQSGEGNNWCIGFGLWDRDCLLKDQCIFRLCTAVF